MSIITNRKITEGQRDAVWVQHQQNRLTGTPQENKAVFDEYSELIREHFNGAMDDIDATLSGVGDSVDGIEERVVALEEINVEEAAVSARASAASASESASQAQSALAQATAYAVKHFMQKWVTTSSAFSEFTFAPEGYAYTSSDYFEVYINGLKLDADKYERSGATITLANAIRQAGNVVEVCVTKYLDPATYVEEAEDWAESAMVSASQASSYMRSAQSYMEQASASATNAADTEGRVNQTATETLGYRNSANAFAHSASASAEEAAASAGEAEEYASNASDEADRAQTNADRASSIVSDIQNVTATATTLSPGSQATASFNTDTDVLTLGIPQGAKGDKGDTGAKGDKGDKGDTGEIPEEQYLYCFPNGTATGSIASFSDGADNLPMKSLNVTITPKQSGSGDPSPSNVRPITGWTDADVKQRGKNLFVKLASATTDAGVTFTPNADGSVALTGTSTSAAAANTTGYLTAKELGLDPNKQYVLTGGSADIWVGLFAQIGSNIWNIDPTSGRVFTPSATDKYRLCIYVRTRGIVTNTTVYPMIREQGTDATFEAYTPKTTPVPLGQTVYGGVVNPVTGELTIKMAYVSSSDCTYGLYDGATARISLVLPNNAPRLKLYAQSAQPNILATNLKTASKNSVTNADYQISQSDAININAMLLHINASVNTAQLAMNWVANNPFNIAYEIETPTTVQLTPTQVASLLGTNNVWSDAGNVTVTYRKDPTLAQEELQAKLEALVLENNN